MLFRWDPWSLAWQDLSGAASGDPPMPRQDMGLAEADGMLYVFGGLSQGERTDEDTHASTARRERKRPCFPLHHMSHTPSSCSPQPTPPPPPPPPPAPP
eukprot:1885790-Rhodomonas_salina.2